MNRALSNVLLFTAGAAVGAAVTWKIFKTKYELVEEDFDEEPIDFDEESEDNLVDSVDEDRLANETDVEVKSSLNKKPPLKEYVQMVRDLSYADTETADSEEDEDVYEPYIIRPEEYGEIHAYETLSLTYYEKDRVLTDELDNRIEDVESIVPADFASYFGENVGDEDSVFVRNDNDQCDYEILRDPRAFADVVGDDPYPAEDE